MDSFNTSQGSSISSISMHNYAFRDVIDPTQWRDPRISHDQTIIAILDASILCTSHPGDSNIVNKNGRIVNKINKSFN